MDYTYQSANSLPQSGNQDFIHTSRLAKHLFIEIFNFWRLSPPSEYKELSKRNYTLQRKPNF